MSNPKTQNKSRETSCPIQKIFDSRFGFTVEDLSFEIYFYCERVFFEKLQDFPINYFFIHICIFYRPDFCDSWPVDRFGEKFLFLIDFEIFPAKQ